MDRSVFFQEVNRLLASDLRKSAIDLLSEYLEKYPDDSYALKAIGKIYLLEKQPKQAVQYLQRALSSVQSFQAIHNHNTTPYEMDQLTSDDLDYITRNATEDEFENQSSELIALKEKTNNTSDNLIDSYDKPLDAYDKTYFDNHPLDLLEDKTEDPSNEFAPLEDEPNENIDDDLVNFDQISIDEEFDWDTIEDFDDSNSNNDLDHTSVHSSTTISRSERAKQVAVAIIDTYHWDVQNLGLLQQILYENGWGPARVAIEREIARGLTPEELELAVFVRKLWTENPQYWISLIHVKSSFKNQTTRDAYKNMSWPEALRVVRLFNNLPCEDEIQHFIDIIYDDWYCSIRLQRQFKCFLYYLKSYTDCVKYDLAENNPFSFLSMDEENTLIEKPYHRR